MNDTTYIRGNADLLACLKKAGCLNFDVYDKRNAELPASMHRLRDEVRNWDKVFDSRNDGVGYRAVLYRRKGSEADRERGALCPPALVFRGSDFTEEEFSGFAISIEIDYRLDWGLLSADARGAVPERFEYVFSPNPGVAQLTSAQLPGYGFSRTSVFDQDAGRTTLRGGVPLSLLPPAAVPYAVDVEWTATIAVWTKNQGDWATNVKQGLGERTTQYDEYAVDDALEAAQYANDQWNGNLMILGHSLGGGLASFATCVAQREFPFMNIKTNVFNAAGVHPATVNRAGTALSAGVALNYTVEDEILTTVQKTPNCPIPLVDSIFRWAGKRMYAHHSLQYEDRASSMEDLWPVPESEFPLVTGAHRIAQGSPTLSQFAERLLEEYWRIGTVRTFSNEAPKVYDRAMRSVEYHYMTSIAETYPYHITV